MCFNEKKSEAANFFSPPQLAFNIFENSNFPNKKTRTSWGNQKLMWRLKTKQKIQTFQHWLLIRNMKISLN
jgi:hypothetical protein